jgi:hypothetical protein
VNWIWDFFQFRAADEFARAGFVVDFEVAWDFAVRSFHREDNHRQLAGFFADFNHIAVFQEMDGMVTRWPFTLTWPWFTNWRAANIVGTNFMRYMTASRRRSSSSTRL